MKEKILIDLHVNVLEKKVIIYLFETMTKYLDIVDMKLGVGKRIRKYNKKSLIKYLNSNIYNDKEVNFGISGDESYFDSLEVRKIGARVYYAIYIDMSRKVFEDNKDDILKIIEEIFLKLNGVIGYIVSSAENSLQNLTDIDWFKRIGGDLKDVKIKKSPSNSEEMIIDKEYNSGHHHFEKGVHFGVWWKMWFGKEYYQYIPKEKLMSFGEALEIRELENDILAITLYEDVWDYPNPKIKELQWRFRNYVGMDEVAHRLIEERKNMPIDPTIEIELVEGQVRILKGYQDENGEISVKSKATQVVIAYTDKKGMIIREETKKFP